jgi:hypothetical protein
MLPCNAVKSNVHRADPHGISALLRLAYGGDSLFLPGDVFGQNCL